MAPKFHKLKVSSVKQETADTISISFDLPADIEEQFKYEPGQYLTVRVFIDGEEYRRAYSLSSSPLHNEPLTITSKRVDQGKVSNWLNDHIKEGGTLEVMPPMGSFTPTIDPQSQTNYIFFSGGSGITPIFSIMKSVLEVEPHSKVTLFYGNRNAESIIFHQELMALKDRYGGRLAIVHSLDEYSDDWEGYKGRIDREKANYLLNKYCQHSAANAEYYICGPSGMMREVELALEDKLVDKKNIHREHFTSNLETKAEGEAATKEAIQKAEHTGELTFPVTAKIILDGDEHEVEIEEEDTVLEAAIGAGIDPPFACQIGACTTCRAMLREGTVSMDDREALTDEEIEEGYVLTCQSHPTSNKLVVDYDG